MTTDAMTGPSRAPLLSLERVGAIIRRDMGALGVFALVVAGVQLLVSAFLRNARDFPQLGIAIGDWRLDVAETLSVMTAMAVPVMIAVFVVMLVQQDNAIEPRHDWMARPVMPGELVLAKTLVLLAVVILPTLIGASIYELLHRGPLIDALIIAYIYAMACIFLVTGSWLSSSPLQAILVPIAAGAVGLLVVLPTASFMVDVLLTERMVAAGSAIEIPAPMPTPQSGAVVFTTRASPADWTAAAWLFATQMVIALMAAAVVLWLLLVARRVMVARLAFAGFFLSTLIVGTVQVSVMDGFVSIAATRVATLEERMAAFRANDANADGKLDKAEYKLVLDVLGFPTQLDSYWRQRDRDRDGFITEAEYTPPIPVTPPAPPAEARMIAFKRNDLNGDGKLDKVEYAATLEQLGFAGQLENYWELRDLDRDGFISEAEYAPAL